MIMSAPTSIALTRAITFVAKRPTALRVSVSRCSEWISPLPNDTSISVELVFGKSGNAVLCQSLSDDGCWKQWVHVMWEMLRWVLESELGQELLIVAAVAVANLTATLSRAFELLPSKGMGAVVCADIIARAFLMVRNGRKNSIL
jgi:hypothetical protein